MTIAIIIISIFGGTIGAIIGYSISKFNHTASMIERQKKYIDRYAEELFGSDTLSDDDDM